MIQNIIIETDLRVIRLNELHQVDKEDILSWRNSKEGKKSIAKEESIWKEEI